MPSDADPHEAYDRIADAYAESNHASPARADYEWPAVRETLPDLDGLRVLDAACGSGHYAGWMAEQGASVVGVDASAAMVDEARARHGDRATFEEADLREPLPFPDGRFDLVVCQLALEHVADWDHVLAEFARVLADGGEVVVSTDHPHTTYRVIDGEPPDVGSPVEQSADYYAVERYHRDWGDEESDLLVPFYRRPLAGALGPVFGAGFVLTDLSEPKPRVEDEHLQHFVENTPRFLVFRARLD